MKRRSFPLAKTCGVASAGSIILYILSIAFPGMLYFQTIVFFAVSCGIVSVSFLIIGAIGIFAEGTNVIARKHVLGVFFFFGSFGAAMFAQMFVDFSDKLNPESHYVAGALFLLSLIFSYFGLVHIFRPPVNYRVKGKELQMH